MDALEQAAVAAIREENGHLLPSTVAAKWTFEPSKPALPDRYTLKTLHGEFAVGKTDSGKTYIHYHISLIEFIPGSIDDAKRECAELLLPQLEEVLDEVRVLASMQ